VRATTATEEVEMKKILWSVIGRTRNGWHATGAGPVKSFGNSGGTYREKERVTTYSNSEATLADLAANAVDGALVYDMTGVDEGLATRFVVSGPMVDPALATGEVKRFGEEDRKAAARMLPDLEGSFHTFAKAAQNPKFSGLDTVAPDVYIGLVRALPGARVGRVHGGAVVWEG
jgi:hypothetical protein